MSGERNLIVAVLESATKDYLGKNMKNRRDAEYWFQHEQELPFSFRWCCRHLNVDPTRTFKKIRGMTLADFRKRNKQPMEVKP